MIACVFIFVLDSDPRFSVNGQLVVNLVGGFFVRGILVYCCWIAYHGQIPTAIRSTIASDGHLMVHFESPVFPPVVLSEASCFQGFNSPTVGVYFHFWEDSRNLQPMEHTQTGSYISLCCLIGKVTHLTLQHLPFFSNEKETHRTSWN